VNLAVGGTAADAPRAAEKTETVPVLPAAPAGGLPAPGAPPAATPYAAAEIEDVLTHVPALVALTYGPAHRLAYLNRSYAETFGPRTLGAPASQAMPELEELGLLPLLDQVYRSGRPRTVKARKVPSRLPGRPPRYFTFVCAPVREREHLGHRLSGLTVGPLPGADGPAAPPASAPPPSSPAAGNPLPLPPASAASPDAGARTGGRGRSTPRQSAAPARTAGGVGGALVRRPLGPLAGLAARRRAAGGPAVCGVLVFGAEVTDQVEAADRLRESERRQREAAVTLQRSLLPQALEQPDDLRVAALYQPGGADAAVGGDWYDVITLGGGRTALVIGDVMGRGMRAAAVMGQLRTAVRAYARLDLPPHEVLQLLDGLATEIDPTQIATCVYAVFDPNEQHLTYASAGHLPLLVREADGKVTAAAEQTGPPLGTGGWLYTSATVPFCPGAAGVLYTDGLVERRDQDIDEGIDRLASMLDGAAGPPDVVCARLLRTMGVTPDHDDDVAVLVFHLPERDPEAAELFRGAALELVADPEAASRARAFTTGVLASWQIAAEVAEPAVQAVSELVANSVTHACPPMRLRLRRTDRRLVVEVTDADDHLPRRRRAEPADEHGRGVALVASLASQWGTRRTPEGGKAVWCEFLLPRGAGQPENRG